MKKYIHVVNRKDIVEAADISKDHERPDWVVPNDRDAGNFKYCPKEGSNYSVRVNKHHDMVLERDGVRQHMRKAEFFRAYEPYSEDPAPARKAKAQGRTRMSRIGGAE